MSESTPSGVNAIPILGTDPFDFHERHVSEAVAELQKEQDQMAAAFDSAGQNERLFIERRRPVSQRQLAALSVSPNEVLQKIKSIYERVVQLKDSPEAEIISNIRTEFPDALDLYPLLRKKPWGYRLGQRIQNPQSLES